MKKLFIGCLLSVIPLSVCSIEDDVSHCKEKKEKKWRKWSKWRTARKLKKAEDGTPYEVYEHPGGFVSFPLFDRVVYPSQKSQEADASSSKKKMPKNKG